MAEEMIAYCGLSCTECPAFIATQDNDVQKAKETAALWSKEHNMNVTVQDVWCDGCQVEGKKCAHCKECKIRACGKDKGVATCAACDDYPCEQLAGFFKMVPIAQQNLERLRA